MDHFSGAAVILMGGSSAQATAVNSIVAAAAKILNTTKNTEFFGYRMTYTTSNSGTGVFLASIATCNMSVQHWHNG